MANDDNKNDKLPPNLLSEKNKAPGASVEKLMSAEEKAAADEAKFWSEAPAKLSTRMPQSAPVAAAPPTATKTEPEAAAPLYSSDELLKQVLPQKPAVKTAPKAPFIPMQQEAKVDLMAGAPKPLSQVAGIDLNKPAVTQKSAQVQPAPAVPEKPKINLADAVRDAMKIAPAGSTIQVAVPRQKQASTSSQILADLHIDKATVKPVAADAPELPQPELLSKAAPILREMERKAAQEAKNTAEPEVNRSTKPKRS